MGSFRSFSTKGHEGTRSIENAQFARGAQRAEVVIVSGVGEGV